MKPATRVLLAALVMVALASRTDVMAASACVGHISSQAIEPLPAGASVDVDIFNDTEENLQFRDAFLAALAAAGHATGGGAPLALSFSTESESGMFAVVTGREVDRSLAPANSASNQITANVSRLRDNPRPSRASTGSQIQVLASLRDNRTKRVIWLADLRCEMLTSDRLRIAEAIIPPFVEALGRTVASAQF